MDTIYALASASGKAGVSVIRVSGPEAFPAASILTRKQAQVRKVLNVALFDSSADVIDRGLMLSFEAPKSFTGEDVIEFQVHGSTAIVAAVLRELGRIAGLRLAEPGEFTRRALENGKLDLTRVEGLADLIDAETELQRKQAQRVFSGALAQRVETWRAKLIRAAALIEATIDFVDEEVPEDVTPEVLDLLQSVQFDLQMVSDGFSVSERIRAGFEVAIVGAPNVGKSSLLNVLAGRDAAITSDIAGTTRDVIEVRMDLKGLPVTILDTAGVRESDDLIENLGIDRTKSRAEAADLRVFLVMKGEDPVLPPKQGDLVYTAKADLAGPVERGISSVSGQGVEQLIGEITDSLSDRVQNAGIVTRERHVASLRCAISGIALACQILERGLAEYDLSAFEIRSAVSALETIVGRVDVENLLDEIFASFCLGK